jgi:hypothetical protein
MPTKSDMQRLVDGIITPTKSDMQRLLDGIDYIFDRYGLPRKTRNTLNANFMLLCALSMKRKEGPFWELVKPVVKK